MAGQRPVVVVVAQTVCIDRSHLCHLVSLKGVPDLTALPSTLPSVHNTVIRFQATVIISMLVQTHANQCILGNTYLRSDVPRKCMVDDDQCVSP